MCACACACAYACVHVCVSVCLYVHLYICVCLCISVSVYECVCVCTWVCTGWGELNCGMGRGFKFLTQKANSVLCNALAMCFFCVRRLTVVTAIFCFFLFQV